MVRFDTCGGCVKMVLAFLLFLLPACTAFQKTVPNDPDPRIPVIQRENRQLVSNQLSTQKAVEDIYKRLNALDAKLDFLETRIQDLVDHSKAMPSTSALKKEKTGPSARVSSSKKDKTTAQPTTRKVIAKKTTKKPAVSTKHAARQQYDQAYSAYVAHRYDEALALFKSFLKNNPNHDLADNAQYWVGEIYYDLENYPSAILAFKEVVTKYSEKNKAPDALLKIGYAYVALDDPSNARLFLKRVIKNYPFSDAEAKARVKLKEIQNL